MTTSVEFESEINVQTKSRGGYRRFIESLRVRLGVRFSHNLRALAVQEEPPTRFFNLVIRTNDHSVRFRFRMDNLYLIGYQMADGRWLEFNNEAGVHLIREQGTAFLGFTGHYSELGGASDTGLAATRVGFYNLGYGINQLATSEVRATRAHYLIVVIMMFSEATRLLPVLEYTAANFDNSHGTSSNDYNATNRNLEGLIVPWIIAIVRSWGNFSGSLLRADAYPEEPFQIRRNEVQLPNGEAITNRFQIVEILGILLGLIFRNPQRPRFATRSATRSDTHSATNEGQSERQFILGLQLLQVFSVRIDTTVAGDLYGTITVNDGLNTEYLYNRTISNPKSISPGQNALLIGPAQSSLAISNFIIQLLLTHNRREIVNTDISWVASEIGNLYDVPIFRRLDGTNGSVTVNYVVLRSAAAATITLTLEQGGGNTSNVYGRVSARYGNWRDDPNTTSLLFNRASVDYVVVSCGGSIPLLRSVVAVPLYGSLIVTATLYNYIVSSPDGEIAIGTVELPAQMSGTSFRPITTGGNSVRVTVDWSIRI